MGKKSVKLYTDNVLDAFYDAIKNNTLHNLHIPHSETEELCKVRIEEMVEVIQMTMDYPVEYRYKCEPKKSV